ncbi:unnamed protein product [Camellia sinensis]
MSTEFTTQSKQCSLLRIASKAEDGDGDGSGGGGRDGATKIRPFNFATSLRRNGVDLFGIVTCVLGDGSVKDNPVIQSLDRLKQLNSDSTDRIGDQNDVDEVIVLLDKLVDLCSIEGSGNAAIAMNPDFFRIDDGSSDRLNLGFLMEPCDAKLWEARYPMSPFEDFDFVSTGNMIEEIFGPNTETSKLSDKRKALDSGSPDDHLN